MDPPQRDSVSNTQGTRRLRARKSIAHMPSPERTLDKENNVQELARSTQETKQQISTNTSKKSRSKSLGPGGLDALKDTSGNRRKSVAFPQPKSILKPTIPLSPLREIPTRRSQPSPTDRPASPAKSPRPSRTQDDVSPSNNASIRSNELKQSSQAVAHHDAAESDAIGTAATVDPEAEERQKRKNEIQKQRDARRKSMANRRVSFAPDATLHTWDTEVLEDSTGSPASTASSRRASALSQSQAPTSNRPTTPAERTEDPLVQRSPEHQRSAHQKKRRRSSGIPPMNFNNPDVLSSSPYSGSSAIDEDETVHSFVDGEVTISGSDHGDGTLIDTTMHSVEEEVSFAIPKDTKDNGELDASLQDAAERAGTRNMEIDENGEIPMEIAGDEVTAAFKPWVRQSTGVSSPHPAKTMIKPGDEKINPFSPAFKQATGTDGSPSSFADDLDVSMDMTNAVGGIRINGGAKSISRRKSVATRRQTIAQHRRTSEEGPDLGEGTMDFTTAVGGLQRPSPPKHGQMALDENEDLSMEFTSVFGGVNSYGKAVRKAEQTSSHHSPTVRTQHVSQSDLGIGEDDEDGEDGDMEITTSIGGILPKQSLKHDQEEGVKNQGTAEAMINASVHGRREVHAVDNTQFASSTLTQLRSHAETEMATNGTTPGSPPAAHPNRRSLPHYAQPTMASSTPSKVPQTPTHQVTPQPTRPTTPGKTPPSANISMRKTSPKKLFQQEIRAAKSPSKSSPGVFRKDGSNGHQTPSVVLAPKLQVHRRISGVGIDKEGLGSPRIAALLDRRTSIGGSSDVFAPKGTSRSVKFDDPRHLDVQISKDLEEDQRSEVGQLMTAFEKANEGETDATVTLKDMMQSMTPKKNKLKGRKSLAVGAARGVLGKRPAELDSEDDLSPRTFGNATSPVKRIRLNDPSMFPEASIRSAQNTQARLTAVSGNAGSKVPTDRTSPTASPIAKQTGASGANGHDMPEEKIGLQDFLNLTNIRFMELTTTKRRPTMAPSSYRDTEDLESEDPTGMFVKSVTAGACTIPMLELYQHACRELKSYISEGRNVVRSIEEESLVENPPLFREYLTATPSTRQVMDNQFKHMKTNARLLSKATWYEWRMKLLDGLVESLTETAKGVERDDDILSRREATLFPHLRSIMSEKAALEHQVNDLKSRAIELAKYDPEDLDAARERLKTVSSDIESKSRIIETNQESLEDLDEQIAAARNAKNEAQDEIEKARRQREECRGWSVTEVRASQTRVEHLTSQTGWSVTGATGSSLRLSFEKQLELSFDTRAFLPLVDRNASPGLGLIYTGNEAESTIARFFVQYLRAQLHALTPSSTEAAKLLRFIASGWSCARAIRRQVTHLELRAGPTETRIVNDERMAVDVDVLLHGVKTKVKVSFELRICTGAEETIHARAQVSASVVYGEEYREDRMSDFVRKRISGDIGQDASNGHQDVEAEGAWASAVVELRKGLIRRGAK